jgi:hypothetical protein
MLVCFFPLIFLCLPGGVVSMRKLNSSRKLRDGFRFRKTPVRHRKFPETSWFRTKLIDLQLVTANPQMRGRREKRAKMRAKAPRR